MSDSMKIVQFERYCKRCEHKNVKETEDPCNECLSEGGQLYSHKPLNFKEGGSNDAGRSKSQKFTRNRKASNGKTAGEK